MAEGWECPRCHATYAPFVTTCAECKPLPSSLRERLTPATALPVAPYTPPVYPAPLFPAPNWPYQDRIVWCDVTPQSASFTLSPEARARMTMCSGAGTAQTFTLYLGPGGNEPETGDDDGTAGVPAKV